MPHAQPNVLVIVPASFHYGREALRGIAAYVRGHGRWRYARDPWSVHDDALVDFAGRCNGVLALSDPSYYPTIKVPRRAAWVVVADVHPTKALCVRMDNAQVGALAAEHLMTCGFRNFAYCGYLHLLYSHDRGAAFRATVDRSAASYHEYAPHSDLDREWNHVAEHDAIKDWLAGLPRPIGIFAANDARAATVTTCCRELGLRIPQDVAVVGADNDELVCEFSNPPLSSVALNARQVGYAAAEMLDARMAGQTPDPPQRHVAPLGVAQRQSSDTFAAEDPLLADVFRHLREHACAGLTVEGLVRQFPIARRTLERACRRLLGHSLLAEIRRVQLAHACDLLANTDMTVDAVARACGLREGKYLAEVFRKVRGTTPREYRRSVRRSYAE